MKALLTMILVSVVSITAFAKSEVSSEEKCPYGDKGPLMAKTNPAPDSGGKTRTGTSETGAR